MVNKIASYPAVIRNLTHQKGLSLTAYLVILTNTQPHFQSSRLRHAMAVSKQDGPQVISLTNEERDSGVMGDKKLYDAIEAFFTDGLVVIENAIDVEIIDKLNTRMLQDTEKLLKGQGQVHFK